MKISISIIDTNSILLISKLKYPEQIEMEDMHELLYQLKTEGMFLQSPDEPCLKSFRFCFNDMHESLLRFPLNKTGHIYKYKDKILKKMLNEETEAERLIRLMRKRAQRVYFDKLVQFDIDVKNLYQALPENKWVSFSEIMNLLPEAWKIWRARNTPWYVMRAVHLLQLKRFIKRCPEREMFIKLEKDIGY